MNGGGSLLFTGDAVVTARAARDHRVSSGRPPVVRTRAVPHARTAGIPILQGREDVK